MDKIRTTAIITGLLMMGAAIEAQPLIPASDTAGPQKDSPEIVEFDDYKEWPSGNRTIPKAL
ncbi:MAG: hypothetical protein LIO77_00630, partial [Rikenellaceae bacterium]|nr:hypothetical protein [Rikenellaceae bacterium]